MLSEGAVQIAGPSTENPPVVPELALRLSCAGAVIGAAGSIIGLLAPDRIYGQETMTLADASAAQDVVNLVVVAPAIVVLSWLAARGHVMAYLYWLGCMLFTAYNYAIYAFSIHFGPLFLPWVAVLGLSAYAIAISLTPATVRAAKDRFEGRPLPITGWALITIGALFSVLWLREIIPDLLAGRGSASALQWSVPTNPVHVLDLALFLPGVIGSGVLLLRRRALGYAAAPGQLVFLLLTCGPILVTPAVEQLRGHSVSAAVMAPIGVVLTVTAGVLWWTVRNPSPHDDSGTDEERT